MSKFVEIDSKTLFNADAIERIDCGDDENISISFRGHKSIERLYDPIYNNIVEELTTTIIPAQPGFELLVSAPPDSDDFWFSRHAIIAWRIGDKFTIPIPITAGNHTELANPQAILEPSGRVFSKEEGRDFDNLEEWEKYVKDSMTKSHKSKT